MKTTVVVESLSYYKTNVLFQSILQDFKMYEIATTNLKMVQERRDPKNDPIPIQLLPGDTVLVQNHTKGPFDPKYIGDYHVVSIKGNQIEVKPSYRDETCETCKICTPGRPVHKTCTRLFYFWKKSYTETESKAGTWFALAISRYIPHNKYWTVNSLYKHPKCGCQYIKFCWRKEV